MTTTATATRTNGQRASAMPRPPTSAPAKPGRHRQLPLVVVGVLLVLGCALAFTDASLHLGSREEVLVVAQPVSAGQVLTASDLRAARVSTGSGLHVVPADQESSVIGRRAAVPLVAGALLTTSEVGIDASGRLGIRRGGGRCEAGRVPAGPGPWRPGQVVPVTSSSDGSSATVTSGSPVGAIVLAVEPASADSDSPTVFSLQVSTSNAGEVASLAAAGQASLIEVGAAG